MLAIRLVSIAAALVMAAAIAHGFAAGEFSAEGREILGLAWGRVTLIDLYVGLGLFGTWVAFRERSWPATLVWWMLLVVLGNLAAAGYLAFVSMRAESPRQVLLGGGR